MLDPLNIDAVECNGQGSLLRHLTAWGHLHRQSCLHMHKAQGFAIYQAYVTQTQIWSPSRSFVRRSQTCIRSCSIIHFRKDDGRMCNTLALPELQRSRHNIYVSMCHHVCAQKAWRTLAHPSLKLQWRKWKSSFKARKKWRLCIVSFSRSLTLTDQWYQPDFSSIFLSFQGVISPRRCCGGRFFAASASQRLYRGERKKDSSLCF